MGWLPASSGTFVRRVRQTLTNKTSFAGTSAEQWGTEEATLDDAVLPQLTNVTVYALLDGNIANSSTTANAVGIRTEISLDGGSTWDSGSLRYFRGESATANAENDCTRVHQVTGTITGDIQARATAICGAGASAAYQLTDGVLYMEVVV